MTTTSLALLKAQLNFDHDYDDALLAHKLAVAEEWIGNFTGTPFADHGPIPASLTEAALQRESASEVRLSAVPFGVLELISPYRESVTGHVAS